MIREITFAVGIYLLIGLTWSATLQFGVFAQ